MAVIGSGISGIASAHLLSRKHDVTLFEASDRLGGHTHTVDILEEGQRVSVDTGFIVLNDRTYPLLHQFFTKLKVPVRSADMSFGFHNPETGFCYSGANMRGLFAQRRHLLSPKFWCFLLEIKNFCVKALLSLEKGEARGMTLRDFISRYGFSKFFVDSYLIPMAASIWSTPADMIDDYPAESIFAFFKNHGLLNLADRPQWQTVVGGSHSYIKAFQESFKGKIVVNSPAKLITRETAEHSSRGAVKIDFEHSSEYFDAVILATQADQALRLLKEPTSLEKQLLGPWKYNDNATFLHTDTSLMPPRMASWASWNYSSCSSAEVSVTYDMNRLQGLQSQRRYLVTLNPPRKPRDESIIKEIHYRHPRFDLTTFRIQERLQELNREGPLYFVGSYFGYGFHEDALRSAVTMAESWGERL